MKDIVRSQFRLPEPLYEKLKDAAHDERRSVNAEIVARLEASFSVRSSSAGTRPKAEEISTWLPHLRLSELLTPEELETIVSRVIAKALERP